MIVEATLTDGFKVEAAVENHTYTMDQAKNTGEPGEGMTPGRLMLTSVTGCKVMVARGFLDAKEITFDRIDAELDYEMTGPNSRPTLNGTITIQVVGAQLDEKEEKQLHRIVDTNCIVGNLLDPEKATIETVIEIV